MSSRVSKFGPSIVTGQAFDDCFIKQNALDKLLFNLISNFFQ